MVFVPGGLTNQCKGRRCGCYITRGDQKAFVSTFSVPKDHDVLTASQ